MGCAGVTLLRSIRIVHIARVSCDFDPLRVCASVKAVSILLVLTIPGL